MKPIDHFFSQIDSLVRSFRSEALTFQGDDERQLKDRLAASFLSLTAPIIGKTAAGDLCLYCFDKLEGKKPEALEKLGFIAAFLTGEYDDNTMRLDAEDWDEIKETLNDASGEMNMDMLTELLGELLNRGVLDT